MKPGLEPFRLAAERFKDYPDDLRKGLHRKVASAALLIFLTSVGPAMSFGEYLSNNLEGSYGVLEVLVSTALCGTIFSLISGSPLVIVGATGPFSIFGYNCFRLAKAYNVPFMPWMAWIMLISGLQHIFLGLIGASSWYLPYITSFSGQVFGVLISMIYIVESCQNVAKSFSEGSAAGRLDAAFFFAIISFGQLAACLYLHGARSWLIFTDKVRDIIADYGPSLTIFAFTGFTLIPSFSSVNVVRINIPTTFNTTSGRSWVVDLNHAELSTTAKGLAFFPALVLTALYFFDHNVSALLTHRIEYGLKKKVCYDWDFMVLGLMMIVCGFLGLPPCNGLIPNSPMHSKALVVYKSHKQLETEAKRSSTLSFIDVPNTTQLRRNSASAEADAAAAAMRMQDLTGIRSPARNAIQRIHPPGESDTAVSIQELPSSVDFQKNLESAIRKRKNSLGKSDAATPTLAFAEERLPPHFDHVVDQRLSYLLKSFAEKRLPPQFDHVVDQRLSNLLQSGMVAVMLVILPALALVPTSVVTGLFLFMGVESLLDGDVFSRMIFPFVQRHDWPLLDLDSRLDITFLSEYRNSMNVYTLIQLVAFGIVFYVTQTVASIAFPLFILLLVPLRFNVLPRYFEGKFIETIDHPLIESEHDEEKRLSLEAENVLSAIPPPPDLLQLFQAPPNPPAAVLAVLPQRT